MQKRIIYALSLLIATIFVETHAVQRTSDHPGVRSWVTQFVADYMDDIFTATDRRFTSRYAVRRSGGHVVVTRTPSAMSVPPVQAHSRFDAAVADIIHHVLDIYDDNGLAERIDVYETNDPNTFYFVPVFLGPIDSSSDEEDGIEDDATRDYSPDSDEEVAAPAA